MSAALGVHSPIRLMQAMIPAVPTIPRNDRVKTNPAFDAYIRKAVPFARPILKKIRMLFHKASPDIEEVMKWSFPHFEYRGIVGSMAAFKQHATFGFWKASLMNDPYGLLDTAGETSMSRAKFTDVTELPPDKVLIEYIREAVALNEQGVKIEKPRREKKPEAKVPADLQAALKKNKKALAAFEAFSPSHRREYVEWITEAKQEATRKKRVAQAIEWLAEGKSRHWKYQRT
jgi:uncharacterized protein YdeI (YjbR/CyaY-like superfamily)